MGPLNGYHDHISPCLRSRRDCGAQGNSSLALFAGLGCLDRFRLLPRGGAAHRWPLAGLGLTAVRDDHGLAGAAAPRAAARLDRLDHLEALSVRHGAEDHVAAVEVRRL